MRWWQPVPQERNRLDWALDAVFVGGNATPPDALTYAHPDDLVPPMWLRRYNGRIGEGVVSLFVLFIFKEDFVCFLACLRGLLLAHSFMLMLISLRPFMHREIVYVYV